MTKSEMFVEAHARAKAMKIMDDEVNYKFQFALELSNLCHEEDMKKLESMSLKELMNLEMRVSELIEMKRIEDEQKDKIFNFHFEHTNDMRKGVPYAAILTLDDDNTLNRQFLNFEKSYGGNEITVIGDYGAHAGEIVEEREGGSWKNDYRYWYIINADGSRTEVLHDIKDSKQKAHVKKYLAGKITAKQLIEGVK